MSTSQTCKQWREDYSAVLRAVITRATIGRELKARFLTATIELSKLADSTGDGEALRDLVRSINRLDGSYGVPTVMSRAARLVDKLGATNGRPRRYRPREKANLTTKQIEVCQIVGECSGNVAKAARRLGLSDKTVRQHYEAALAKLGKSMPAKVKTVSHRADHRGQATLTDDDRKRHL